MSSRTPRTRNRTGARTLDAWSSPWAPLLALLLFMLGTASAEAQSWVTAPEASASTDEDVAYAFTSNIVVTGTPGTPPTLTVTSGNQTVLPNASIALGNWNEAPAGTFTRTVTATPAANRNTVRDNSNAPVTITFNLIGAVSPIRSSELTISEVNDVPVAGSDALSAIAEDSGVRSIPIASLLSNDNAGLLETSYQTISLTSVTAGTGGTVAINGANVDFSPTLNFNGAASFSYVITDDGQTAGAADPRTATGSVTFTVTAVNDPPVAVDDSATTAEDTLVSINVVANDTDVEGDTRTLTAVSNAVNGTVAINAGLAEFTPSANFNGTGSFEYTVSDGNGGSDTGLVTITVTAVNDAPVVNDQSFSVSEAASNGTSVGTVLASDVDVGDTLGYALSAGPFAINATTGEITVNGALDFDTTPSYTLTVTVTDNGAGTLSDTATITINVTDVNEAPTYNDASRSIDENVAAGTNVGAAVTGTDPDAGQVLSYSIVSGNTGGAFAINSATGQITTAAAINFEATPSYSLVVRATDNGTPVLSDDATVSITVNNLNDAPVVNDQSFSIAEDAVSPAAVGTVVATDQDTADTLSYGLTGTGPFTINAGTGAITTTGALDFDTTPSYTLTVTVTDDGAGTLSDTATITINVTNVNEAPTATPQSVSVAEDGSVVVTLAGTDPDAGTTLTYAIGAGPTNGALGAVTGNTVTYTPNGNYNGADSFTFTVSDGQFTSAAATVSITVTEVNDAPDAVNDALSDIAEDSGDRTITAASLLVNDTNGGAGTEAGQTLTVTAVGGAVGGTVSLSGSTITFSPTLNFNGAASFTYTITDNGTTNGAADPLTDTATVSFNITAVNDAPTFTVFPSNIASVLEDSTTGPLSIVVTDVENDPVNIVATTGNQALFPNANVQVTPQGQSGTYSRTISFTTATDQNSGIVNPDFTEFNVTVVDSLGGLTTQTFRVDFVTAVNDAPIFSGGANQTVAEDAGAQTVAGWATAFQPGPNTATDESGQTLVQYTVTQVGGTLAFTTAPAVANNGMLTYAAAPNANGSATFEVRAVDNGNGTAPNVNTSAPRTLVINVTAVNDAPVANNGSATTNEDTAVAATASASDVDGDTLTYSVVTGPANGVLTGTGPNWTYTPAANYFGSDSFTFRVNDGTVDSNTATFSLTVTAVNDAPVGVADNATTPEDTAVSVNVLGNDTDVDNTPAQLSVASFTQPANGTVAADGALLRYTPNANFNGSDSFTYIVTDGSASSAATTVSLTVTAVNDVPVASNGSATTNEDTAVAATVVATDVDAGDTLTYQIVSGPTNGTLSGTAPNYTYTPNANYAGSDSFTFTATDSASAVSNVATFSLTVTAVNDAPVGVADSATTPEDTAISVNVLGNDTDVDNTPAQLSVASFTQPANGTVAADGALLRYTPNANFNGSDSFTYIVTDGSASSAATTVSLTVTAVNDAPVAVNDTYTVAEDQPLTITAPGVLGNDTDVDSPSSGWTAVLGTGPTAGTLTLAPNGGFTYTPNANFKGSDSFTYFVNDGALQSALPATVTLTVSAVNDAPTITAPANQTILEDQATGALAFTVGDVETPAASLTVVAASSNTALIPNASIVLGGSGANRTVTATPVANGNGGPVTITLTVTDGGGLSSNAVFTVDVTPVNDAPSYTVGINHNEAPGTGLRTVPNWATDISAGPANESSQTLAFEVSEASDPANVVTNVQILTNGNLQFVLTGASGTATINSQLRDNGGTLNGGVDVSPAQTFTISVAAGADLAVAMQASFNAIDGLVNYTITATNNGPSPVTGATLVNNQPAGLTAYSWTCVGVSGGVCPSSSGNGSINFLVNLPANGSVIVQAQGTYNASNPPVTITNAATITPPVGVPDSNTANNTISRSLTFPLFSDSFEALGQVVALDKSLAGSWNAAAIDGSALAGAVNGKHPVEAVRYVRGASTVVVFVRGIDGRVEARLAQRTGKSAAWAAGEWVVVPASGVQLQWLSAANGDDVGAAELRAAAN